MTGIELDPAARKLDRRQFLARLSAAAAVLAAHGSSAGAGTAARPATGPIAAGADAGPRILELELHTSAPLERMASFYGEALGLAVTAPAPGYLRVAAGATEIRFVAAAGGGPAPFYHFAFNIPQHKILAAREWQLERTPLFLTPENLRDPAYPADVRHFRGWNAHSVFFWDPAGNVVEYIARHDLPAAGAGAPTGSFSSADILYASEIAFVVDDVPGAGAALEQAFSLPRYRSASEVFHAAGDERGLLLLFARGREIGDRLRGRPASASVFPTRATLRATDPVTHRFPGYPYEVEGAAAPE